MRRLMRAGVLTCSICGLFGSFATSSVAQESKPVTVADIPHTRASDVIYGRKLGVALTMEVLSPKKNGNRAAIVLPVSGG